MTSEPTPRPSTKTQAQRLFAAACVRLKLSPGSAPLSGLYEDILADLNVTPDEVEAYLNTHRPDIEAALRRDPS